MTVTEKHIIAIVQCLILALRHALKQSMKLCWLLTTFQSDAASAHWLAVWLSGNTLASINVVALRQTRLVLGWVTVCGRVNHLGM